MRQNGKVFWICFFTITTLIVFAGAVFAEEITYHSGSRRNPFIPLQGGRLGGVSSAKGFILEGIIYDPPANSVALIGGQPCKVGETIGEGKVLEIRKDHVVVEINAETKTLWIREDERFQNNSGGEKTS